MLIVMKQGSAPADLERVVGVVRDLGFVAQVVPGAARVAVAVTGNTAPIDPLLFEGLPGVARAVPVTRPGRLAARESHPGDTQIRVGPVLIGGGSVVVVAGPCAVETEAQLIETARAVKLHGANMLRGGAYKPRSSPYSFQGLGREGLRLLAAAREETGLPVISEAVDEASLDAVAEHADVVQIGARSMQNYPLLRQAGRCGRPVFLKRGMSATLDDLLLSAEYVLSEGNPDVILCERGIRTFSDHSRFTLDLSVVPAAQEATHLPIFVDPSHATGVRSRVAAMALAALAAGADGIMVEVHPEPVRALSDGPQALLPDAFGALVRDLRALSAVLGRRMEPVR